MKVFAFSWNTQSHRLAESLDPKVLQNHREGYFHLWNNSGQIPDFWIQLKDKIQTENPDVVVISFQEDVSPGSYFHSHCLPDEMKGLGYQLFERIKQMGIGRTTFQGLTGGDIFVRGLRMSVYLSDQVFAQCRSSISKLTYTNSIFQNKGGVAVYLTLPNQKTLAIINCHLPFQAQSLKEAVQDQDPMIRQNAVFEQNIFFNEMYRKLVLSSQPDHVLLMGDLNYRYHPFVNWSAKSTGQAILDRTQPKEIRVNDEFYHQMIKKNIYSLEEGIQNQGPTFPPTGKMKINRNPNVCPLLEDYSLGKCDQRVPSHCDRILYQNLNCLEYDRVDIGMMVYSDHAGVWGTYEIPT